MTQAKSMTRRRRASSEAVCPPDLLEWFEHGGRAPMKACLPEWNCWLPTWWRQFVETHPGAKMPAGYEFLFDGNVGRPPAGVHDDRKGRLAILARKRR